MVRGLAPDPVLDIHLVDEPVVAHPYGDVEPLVRTPLELRAPAPFVALGPSSDGYWPLPAPALLAVAAKSTTARLSARMPRGTIVRFMRPLAPTRALVVIV